MSHIPSDDPSLAPPVIDPVVVATDRALTTTRTAEAPLPRPSARLTSQAVARTADTLFAHLDPLDTTSVRSAQRPDLPHFYAREVLCARDGTGHPLDWLLGTAYANSDHLYLQGAALGVGASTLAQDYARAFNYNARVKRDPRRAAYIKLMGKIKTEAKFLDVLSLELRARISLTELRHRGAGYLAKRLRAAAHRQNVVMYTIDHVSNLGPDNLHLLAGLMSALDPGNDVALDDDDPLAGCGRVGLVLVDHTRPTTLFRSHPEVLELLTQRSAVLPPYTTVAQIADALRQAGIGLDDFDLADTDDCDIAAEILKQTGGLSVLIAAYVNLIDQLSRYHRCRPTPTIVHEILPYVQRLVELRGIKAPDGSVHFRTTVRRSDSTATTTAPDVDASAIEEVDPNDRSSSEKQSAAQDPERAGRNAPASGRSTGRRPRVTAADGRAVSKSDHQSVLRTRREARGIADRERRKIVKKSNVTLK